MGTACVFALGRGFRGLDSARLVAIAVVAGVIWALGSLCFQWALQGPAGPATAIANVNSAGVLILQIVFYHPQIADMKLIGMAVCIAGAATIALSGSRPSRPVESPFVLDEGAC